MRALICAVFVLLPTSAFAQLQQDDPLEAVMTAPGRSDSMPVIEERLGVDIDGQHATTTLLQVYRNTTGTRTEGQYRLRAGWNTHVEGFAYWNGEQKIVGEVFEKQTARAIYDATVSRRRDPGLLEQDGEGAFAFRVFPIEARENKRVELRWTKWLDRRSKVVRYRAPITRADAEIVMTIKGAVKNVRSSTHRLHIEKTSDGVRLRSEGGRTTGQLVVEWEVDEPDWQPSVYVQPSSAGDGWFALALPAPELAAKAVAPKDVTIVVDRSGSMLGESIEHARAAAVNMVQLLNPGDRVNVISFSDEVDPLFTKPTVADADTRKHAINFITRLHEGGGTDIGLALRTAIKSQDREGARTRVIVFLTDGQSDAQGALDAAGADTGDVRLFTIGLGKEVNRPLLQRLAALKRGRFVYIDSAAAIESEVGHLASSIAKPLLVDISVEVEGAQAVRLYPRTLPDLFAEDQLLVTGRLRGKGNAKFVIKGRLGGKPVVFTRNIDVPKAATRPWVGRLWAQSRVDHLLEEISLGNKEATEMQNEVIELALAYNFVTPYTSFLAVPESELGAMRGALDAARQRKAKILADNRDAADLDRPEPTTATGTMRRGLATAASPPVAMKDDAEERPHVDRDSDGGGDSAAEPELMTVRKHGCAGCASSGDAGGFAVLFVLALIVRRRRRR